LLASERALQAVTEQTAKALEAQKIKRTLQAMRKVHSPPSWIVCVTSMLACLACLHTSPHSTSRHFLSIILHLSL